MISSIYLSHNKYNDFVLPVKPQNSVSFTGSNKLISPTNTNLKNSLGAENIALLNKIRLIGKANGQEAYLVGGAVRDCLLGKKPSDLDVMINGDALEFPKTLMREDGKTFKKIHLKNIVKRSVVYTDKMSIDIVPLKEDGSRVINGVALKKALAENAKHRDYTVNTMFIQLGEDSEGNLKLKLMDHIGARKDLKANKLVHVSDRCTSPVEAMRGLRFRMTHGMKVDPRTNDIIRECIRNPENRKNINYIRLVKEFYKMFRSDEKTFNIFKLLKQYKAFRLLV